MPRQTYVRLIEKYPFDDSYENVFLFANRNALKTVIDNQVGYVTSSLSFIRHQTPIQLKTNINTIKYCNYGYFIDENVNKTYYFFIDNMKYINENTVEVYYHIDLWNTWIYDGEILETFVLRQHVADDTIGINTQSENITLGDYVSNAEIPIVYDSVLSYFVKYSLPDLKTTSQLSNVAQGLQVYFYQDFDAFTGFIHSASEIVIKSIQSCYAVPRNLFLDLIAEGKLGFDDGEIYTPSVITKTFDRPTTIDGYTPKNNKLFTSPYLFLYVTNTLNSQELFFERFQNPSVAEFKIYTSIANTLECIAVPSYYKNILSPFDYGVQLPPPPNVPVSSDVFNSYIAMNQNSIFADTFISALKIVNPTTMLSGATNLAGKWASLLDLKNQPSTVIGGLPTGTLLTSGNKWGIFARALSITAEYAAAIDSYFNKYGYAINQQMRPILRSRAFYNYVQTAGNCFKGSLSKDANAAINQAFQRGVTMWHNYDYALDYSVDNSILTTYNIVNDTTLESE